METYPHRSPELDSPWYLLDAAPRPTIEHPQIGNVAWASIEATALQQQAEEEAHKALAAQLGDKALAGINTLGRGIANETEYTVRELFGVN